MLAATSQSPTNANPAFVPWLQFEIDSISLDLFATDAAEVRAQFYHEGTGGKAFDSVSYANAGGDVWKLTLPKKYLGSFYTVQVQRNGTWGMEVADPYAVAVGVNGKRAQLIDLQRTDPAGWQQDVSPAYTSRNAMQDAVIYELHIRDASMHASSGIVNKGKFAGLTELNTSAAPGVSTGLSHIKELGVTHVHLLPAFDFNSVDESIPEVAQYNWGYDPANYNVPEGSFATDALDPQVRIKEFKQMVMALHHAGLGVVMDVVYNHTSLSKQSNLHQLAPGHYYRMLPTGAFANASACGNETASELPMMRQLMIESVKHWVREYHVDGFRFDLMGIHDIETMNMIAIELRALKPDILLYGEGWAAGTPLFTPSQLATKANVSKLDGIAVFSDDIRDGIKGFVFEDSATGFVSGNYALKETVQYGIAAGIRHPQVNMQRNRYTRTPYATQPAQVVNYVDCHDNLTLFDKLLISTKQASAAQRKRMHMLAYAVVLTAQGIPFIHAGSEFLRSKSGHHNSYKSPDSINAIDWTLKSRHADVYRFIRDLIEVRRNHSLFRLGTAAAIQQQLQFLPAPEGCIAFTITKQDEDDEWSSALVIMNANTKPKTISVPLAGWQSAISLGEVRITPGYLHVEPLSFAVFKH